MLFNDGVGKKGYTHIYNFFFLPEIGGGKEGFLNLVLGYVCADLMGWMF